MQNYSCLSWMTFKSHDPICCHFKYLRKTPGFIVPRLSFVQANMSGRRRVEIQNEFCVDFCNPWLWPWRQRSEWVMVQISARRPDLAIKNSSFYVKRLCKSLISDDRRVWLCRRDKSAFHAQIRLPFRYLCSGSLLPPAVTSKAIFSRNSKLWAECVPQSSLKLRQSKKQQHEKYFQVSFHLKPKDILQYFSLLYVSCRLSP